MVWDPGHLDDAQVDPTSLQICYSVMHDEARKQDVRMAEYGTIVSCREATISFNSPEVLDAGVTGVPSSFRSMGWMSFTRLLVGRMLSSSSIRMQFGFDANDSTSLSLKRPIAYIDPFTIF